MVQFAFKLANILIRWWIRLSQFIFPLFVAHLFSRSMFLAQCAMIDGRQFCDRTIRYLPVIEITNLRTQARNKLNAYDIQWLKERIWYLDKPSRRWHDDKKSPVLSLLHSFDQPW